MNFATLFFLSVIFCTGLIGQVTSQEEFSIGESITYRSEVLDEDRVLNIYLPSSYGMDGSRSYPVIYLLDGSRDEDFIHISGLIQFCSFSWIDIVEESIVVGIANVDRKRDFTYPSTFELDHTEFPTSGKSKTFIQFVKTELQDLIESRYRVTDQKTLIGQSVGGLLATEILFKHPELFDNYVIVSPSLWWDSENLLDYALDEATSAQSVYIAVGKEGEVMERVAHELYYKLARQRDGAGNLYFQFFPEQDHGDVLHLAVYDALSKLFDSTEK